MKFYFINYSGDKGFFTEKNLVKAIYTAWNIEADLYILKDGVKITKRNFNDIYDDAKLIFAPYEPNEFNSELLKEYGYKMIDGGEEFREIVDIKTDKIIHYDWSEVKQLI